MCWQNAKFMEIGFTTYGDRGVLSALAHAVWFVKDGCGSRTSSASIVAACAFSWLDETARPCYNPKQFSKLFHFPLPGHWIL